MVVRSLCIEAMRKLSELCDDGGHFTEFFVFPKVLLTAEHFIRNRSHTVRHSGNIQVLIRLSRGFVPISSNLALVGCQMDI